MSSSQKGTGGSGRSSPPSFYRNPKRRVCKHCKTIYFREEMSDREWHLSRYCSRKCSGASKRKKHNKASKVKTYKSVTEAVNEATDKQTGKSQLADQHGGTYGNVKRGWYDINGKTMYFRSKWEANYALYLDFLIKHKEIKSWEFEPDVFWFEAIRRGTRSYTPDFKVTLNDDSIEYHEVKGHMNAKSKTKLKRMRIYHPDVKIVLIDSEEYYTIRKQVGKLVGFYE